jgi:DNA invertase Pin-like site-specific DNA recombinase
MARTIAYVRVSTTHQDYENQTFEIANFARRKDMTVDEYVSEVITGKADVKSRKIGDILASLENGDTLIVSEVSRISRSLTAVLNTIEDAVHRGVVIMTVKGDHVFGDNINSKVMAFAFGLAAEIERDLISARTKEALAKKKADGIKLGRPVGSTSPEALKLHGKDEDYIELRLKKVSKAAIARMFDVHVETLRRYVLRQQLDKEVLWRLHQETLKK